MHQPVDEDDLAEMKGRIVEALREGEGIFGGMRDAYFTDSRLSYGMKRLAKPLVLRPHQGFNVVIQSALPTTDEK